MRYLRVANKLGVYADRWKIGAVIGNVMLTLGLERPPPLIRLSKRTRRFGVGSVSVWTLSVFGLRFSVARQVSAWL